MRRQAEGARELDMHWLNRHSHTRRTLDSLHNVDRHSVGLMALGIAGLHPGAPLRPFCPLHDSAHG